MLIQQIYQQMEDSILHNWFTTIYGKFIQYHLLNNYLILSFVAGGSKKINAASFLRELWAARTDKSLPYSTAVLWCFCRSYDIYENTGLIVADKIAKFIGIKDEYTRFFFDRCSGKYYALLAQPPKIDKIENLKFLATRSKGNSTLLIMCANPWLHKFLWNRLRCEVKNESKDG